jgi:hypothetical protein
MPLRCVPTVMATLLLLVPPVAAQEHPHEPVDGERLGRVTFPVSCSPLARHRFEQATAYLHSFWYEKAQSAYGDVLAADSTCAMGYWGQAMSRFHPLWAPTPPAELAKGMAETGRGLALASTARERDYLTALTEYYRDVEGRTFVTRLEAYADAMAGVHRRHPDDREATILYALALVAVGQAHPTDSTYANQRRADSLLEPLFRLEPRHPGLAHYIIHTNDSPALARFGLAAARRYAAIAPDVPHALHMPSHIFTRLGLWNDVITSNARAAAAARRFEESQQLHAMWDQDAHALDYLMYGYLQRGMEDEAAGVARRVARATTFFPENALSTEYALAAIPARFALERERWTDAGTLPVRPSPSWRGTEAITRFARALGLTRSSDTTGARAELDTLMAIERELEAKGGDQAYWAVQVRIQRQAASAWLVLARGDTAGARGLAAEAADLDDHTEKYPVTPGAVLPARELQGDLLLAIGEPGEALAAYKQSLARQPNRARSLHGAAKAARQVRRTGTAR